MPDLGPFAQIAPYLTHPLVLAGFGLLLFFGLLRAVLKSRVMPTVSQSAGGKALLSLLRYGLVVALAVVVLGFALAFYQTQLTTVDPDEIIRDFTAATERAAASQSTLEAIARLEELQDGNAFRAAVVAIVRESRNPDAPRGIDRAIELLRQGETGAAETALAEILNKRLAERATASAEAAEAARNLGAIAYLSDTAKSIEAYRTATELDPDDASSWIFLGRLYLRAGNLSSAELALEQARKAADRTGNERDQGLVQLRLGDVRMPQGDLTGALEAYGKSFAIAEKLAAQDPSNSEWQRDLSVSFERIGDVQSARGDLEAALKAYRDGLAIAEKLAAQDPSNSGWQFDLGISNERVGDVLVAQGRRSVSLLREQTSDDKCARCAGPEQ
jgi:tetratricopeptide (TPR) repeat protein